MSSQCYYEDQPTAHDGNQALRILVKPGLLNSQFQGDYILNLGNPF